MRSGNQTHSEGNETAMEEGMVATINKPSGKHGGIVIENSANCDHHGVEESGNNQLAYYKMMKVADTFIDKFVLHKLQRPNLSRVAEEKGGDDDMFGLTSFSMQCEKPHHITSAFSKLYFVATLAVT